MTEQSDAWEPKRNEDSLKDCCIRKGIIPLHKKIKFRWSKMLKSCRLFTAHIVRHHNINEKSHIVIHMNAKYEHKMEKVTRLGSQKKEFWGETQKKTVFTLKIIICNNTTRHNNEEFPCFCSLLVDATLEKCNASFELHSSFGKKFYWEARFGFRFLGKHGHKKTCTTFHVENPKLDQMQSQLYCEFSPNCTLVMNNGSSPPL